MHLKTWETLKIWLSYGQISEILAKRVDFPEYYHEFVNSSLNLVFLGSFQSYDACLLREIWEIYVVLIGFNFFGPNWLVTATNWFWLVIFSPVRLFWVWEQSLASLSLG